MNDVRHAKRSLGLELRALEGFVGVGIGSDDNIRLYATTADAAVVLALKDRWGESYEGFPVSVVLSPGLRVQSGRSPSSLGNPDCAPHFARSAHDVTNTDAELGSSHT